MSNTNNGFYTTSLYLTQHPIDAMLQFDANAHASVDVSVNGPLNFDGDIDANAKADVKCEQSNNFNIILQILFPNTLLNFTMYRLNLTLYKVA